MISLIGITGPGRHGKDTVGKMLLSHMPHASRFAFADKVKDFLFDFVSTTQDANENKEGTQVFMFYRGDVATSMLNVLHKGLMWYGNEPEDAADMWIEVIRKHHPNFHEAHDGFISFTSSWRQLFQLTGTEWGRQCIDEMFWINPWLPSEETVVTDVRGHGDTEEHRNVEAEAIIKRGGVIIEVYDPRKGTAIRDHASEAGISGDLIDHVIINDGSLEELEDKVKSFMYCYLLNGEC